MVKRVPGLGHVRSQHTTTRYLALNASTSATPEPINGTFTAYFAHPAAFAEINGTFTAYFALPADFAEINGTFQTVEKPFTHTTPR